MSQQNSRRKLIVRISPAKPNWRWKGNGREREGIRKEEQGEGIYITGREN